MKEEADKAAEEARVAKAAEVAAAEAAARESTVVKETEFREITLEPKKTEEAPPATMEFSSPKKDSLVQDLAEPRYDPLPRKYKPLCTYGIAGEGLASAGLFLYMNSGKSI